MSHRTKLTLTALAAALLAIPAWAAQDSPTEPADGAPAAQEVAPALEGEVVEGVIRAVRGPLTQIRFTPDEPWQQAEAGMRVPVGAELRTGARSQIQFVLPPDQIITIDRMSQITLLQAMQQGPSRVKTDVGMVRGRANYQVADPQVEHDASVRSPNATNAVRGTQEFGISDDPLYGPYVYSINTPTQVTNSKGQTVPLGGEGEDSQMSGDSTSEGEDSYLNSILDPSNSRSRTGPESLLVGRFPGLGGLDTNQETGSFRGDQTKGFFQDQFAPLPDIDLNIGLVALLTWETNADLDLFVIDSDNFKLSTFPGVGDGFATTSPNGGMAGPDVNGPGVEFVIYLDSNSHPTGVFEVGAAYFSGPTSNFTIQVRKDGGLVDDIFNGTVGPDNLTQSFFIDIPDALNAGAGLNAAGTGKGKAKLNGRRRR